MAQCFSGCFPIFGLGAVRRHQISTLEDASSTDPDLEKARTYDDVGVEAAEAPGSCSTRGSIRKRDVIFRQIFGKFGAAQLAISRSARTESEVFGLYGDAAAWDAETLEYFSTRTSSKRMKIREVIFGILGVALLAISRSASSETEDFGPYGDAAAWDAETLKYCRTRTSSKRMKIREFIFGRFSARQQLAIGGDASVD
eukprot:TRINITY_DN10058_c0_g1_i1.p1 TRINITY_DN10058_c0_g1~~TRINITY_DN10058_c0_g1_i1.p1  ORF type:complete len:214 (+),score=20.23 TRINITY_DN10058_c0_g1_i1:46-642(+)